MLSSEITQSPLAVLTLIAAPAILTNATTALAQSTIARMLHARDRMHELFALSEAGSVSDRDHVLGQVDRIERQAELLLRALHSIYVALGAFASATLVTLLGEGLVMLMGGLARFRGMAEAGLVLFLIGIGGLVSGSASLFQATRLSIGNMRAEAALIRRRQRASLTNGLIQRGLAPALVVSTPRLLP
jgi:hypothetical protein